MARRSILATAGDVLVCAALYLIAAVLALQLAIPPGYATAVWPAAGIALVCVLVRGNHAIAGVAIASFFGNLMTSFGGDSVGRSIAIAAGIAAGTGLQAAVGAALIRRRVGYPTSLEEDRDTLRFIAYGGPVACLTSCTIGATTLVLVGVIDVSSYPFTWWTWWVGDVIGVLVFAPLALLWTERRTGAWRRRRASVGLPLAIGFGVVAAVFVRTSAWERDRLRTAFERRTAAVATVLRSHVSKYEAVAGVIASYLETSGEPTSHEFARFCAGARKRTPGFLALSWNPIVPGPERAAFEAATGLGIFERDPSGALRPAAPRTEYTPVRFIEPLGPNAAILGFDSASDPIRRSTLDRASATRRLASTARIELLQAGPAAGVLLVAPVVDPTANRVRGFTIAVLRVANVITAALSEVDHEGMALLLRDATGSSPVTLFEGAAGDTSLASVEVVTVADRTWELQIAATPDYLAGQRDWQAWGVLAAGLFFVGLLGVVLLIVTGRASRLQTLAHEVAASEALYRSLYDGSPDMHLTTDWSTQTIVDCNQTLCERLGYAKSELLGQPFHIIYAPDVVPRTISPEALLAIGELVDAERTVRTKTGETIDVSLNLGVVRDADGRVTSARGVLRDITKRKQSDRDRQFLLHLGEVLRSSPSIDEILGAVSLDLGRHLEVARCAFVEIDAPNDRATIHRDHHDGVDSVAGTYAISQFSPETQSEASQGMTIVIEDAATDPRTAARYQTYQRLQTRALVSVPLLRDGVWVMMLIVGSDRQRVWGDREITLVKLVAERVWVWIEHLRVLAKLRESAIAAAVQRSEDRFHALVEGVREHAIFRLDRDGRVASWNRGAERIKGYSEAEILGKSISVFYTPEDQAAGLPRELLAKARRDGHCEAVGRRVRKDGSRFWANVSITPLVDAAGALEGFAKVTRDFTEHRADEEALTQGMREREVLLQEVHHRVKNNLQVISSLINMQVRRLEHGETRSAIAETQTRVLAIALIHEKLYSSKDYAKVRFADYTKSLVQNVVFAAGASARGIHIELAIEDVAIGIDRAIPCGLVINELITNALKHAFGEAGGTLSVELGRVDDRLRLVVADDGRGLPPEFTIDRSASMGLHLVVTLARQLDAELVVSGVAGARFQLTFPADP